MLTAIKGEIDSNTIILGDFNNPLSPMNRSSIKKIKGQHTEWEKIFANHLSNLFLDLYLKYIKKSYNCIIKQMGPN